MFRWDRVGNIFTLWRQTSRIFTTSVSLRGEQKYTVIPWRWVQFVPPKRWQPVFPQPGLMKIHTIFRNEKTDKSKNLERWRGPHHRRTRPEGGGCGGRCGFIYYADSVCSYCPCPRDGVNQQTTSKHHLVTCTYFHIVHNFIIFKWYFPKVF